MKLSVIVTLKKEVLDPQGKVIEQTIQNMGVKNINRVRQGKYFEIEINEKNNMSKEDKNIKIGSEIDNELETNSPITIKKSIKKDKTSKFKLLSFSLSKLSKYVLRFDGLSLSGSTETR